MNEVLVFSFRVFCGRRKKRMVSSGFEPLIPALLARCLNQLGQETGTWNMKHRRLGRFASFTGVLIMVTIWAMVLKNCLEIHTPNRMQRSEKMGYPDVATFDLDYTVWPCYCDSHINPPLKPVRSSNGEVRTVVDASGYQVTIYPDIYRILADLKQNGVKLISASRTWAPDIAQGMLKTFKMSYNGSLVPLGEIFDVSEWGERSKVGHIRDSLKVIYGDTDLKKRSICLFDDEGRNREVERYGIKFVYVKDPERGATWKLYQDYLKKQ